MKVIWVVAGALVDESNQVLVTTRPEGKDMTGLWEFPGGKVKENEKPEQALCRELQEELEVVISESEMSPVGFVSHAYENFHVVILLFLCRKWQGVPNPTEGQKMKWLKMADMNASEMPPADVPLIENLRSALC